MVDYLYENNNSSLKSALGRGETKRSNSKANILKRADVHEYERKIQDLSEEIEIHSSKNQSLLNEKLKLIQKVKQLTEENQKTNNELSIRNKDLYEKSKEIEKLRKNIDDLSESSKVKIERSKNKLDYLSRENEHKETKIESLFSDIQAKNDAVKYFSLTNDINVKQQSALLDEIENLKREKQKHIEKIKNMESQLDEFYINRKSESALLLEIEHLKDDNIRLLQMLKNNEEYKDFAYLAEDCSGGITFVKPKQTKRYMRPNTANSNKTIKKNKIEGENDNENWVPSDAFKTVYEFKNRYHIELNDEMISNLIADLNKIWRDREKKLIARTKVKYESEVLNLRRQMTMKTGFDEFSAMKEISKLKNDLKNARDDVRKYLIERNKIKTTPSGVETVDMALKAANNFQKSKRIMETEIKNLQKKLGDRDSTEFHENYSRLKFNEGALWMIGRCLTEFENLQLKLNEIMIDFQSRVKNSSIEENKIIQNAQSWFIESLESILSEKVEKIKEWHYNHVRNVDSLSGKIK